MWNDTLFLSKFNIMDYSLLVGVDEEKEDLVVGIVGKWMESRDCGREGGRGVEPELLTKMTLLCLGYVL